MQNKVSDNARAQAAYEAFKTRTWDRRELSRAEVGELLEDIVNDALALAEIWNHTITTLVDGHLSGNAEEYRRICSRYDLNPYPNAPPFYRLVAFHRRLSSIESVTGLPEGVLGSLVSVMGELILRRKTAEEALDLVVAEGMVAPCTDSANVDRRAAFKQLSAHIETLEKEAAAIRVLAAEVRALPEQGSTSSVAVARPDLVATFREAFVAATAAPQFVSRPQAEVKKVVTVDESPVSRDRSSSAAVCQEKDEAMAQMNVFFSYSHKDEVLRDELATHLKLLERAGVIRGWHDRRIGAGEDWKTAIDSNLERAQVILLLVSADFLASDYCYDIEMKRALARHDAGEAVVLPIILRECVWSRAPFAKLQALPKDARPVTSWTNRDEAWTNVASGIESAVGRIVGP